MRINPGRESQVLRDQLIANGCDESRAAWISDAIYAVGIPTPGSRRCIDALRKTLGVESVRPELTAEHGETFWRAYHSSLDKGEHGGTTMAGLSAVLDLIYGNRAK
jgi:hypothetical protein